MLKAICWMLLLVGACCQELQREETSAEAKDLDSSDYLKAKLREARWSVTPKPNVVIAMKCEEINECQNGGTCIDNSPCECPPSFTGTYCETEIMEKTYRCSFEKWNMCLLNLDGSDVDFDVYKYFLTTHGNITAPEGDLFASAYVYSITGPQYAYLASDYLAEAAVEVRFQYITLGSPELSFVYSQNGHYTEFSLSTNDRVWQTESVNIPSGKDTWMYAYDAN